VEGAEIDDGKGDGGIERGFLFFPSSVSRAVSLHDNSVTFPNCDYDFLLIAVVPTFVLVVHGTGL